MLQISQGEPILFWKINISSELGLITSSFFPTNAFLESNKLNCSDKTESNYFEHVCGTETIGIKLKKLKVTF